MTDKASIYKIQGTLAALVTESVWDSLLRGQPVGVWEADATKYSLFRNGDHTQTVSAADDTQAIIKFARFDPKFNDFVLDVYNGNPSLIKWDIMRGYPVVLDLPAATIARMQRANLDSGKIVERMRGLASKVHKGMSIEAAAEEVLAMGSTREGKA